MIETNVNLNVHEIGILLSALDNLSTSDQNLIAKDYGSASSLQSRLLSIWQSMDKSKLNLRYDITPSF
jgi:hypothetical protein